jgi:cellulose synthase/poly-beta-1,6-N-acetylglucosamine synthase-like glycosyltransferase
MVLLKKTDFFKIERVIAKIFAYFYKLEKNEWSRAVMVLQLIFWSIVGVVVYSYCLYPLILWVVSRTKKNVNTVLHVPLPTVSLVISVYNEEKNLPAKLSNIEGYDYPAEKMEILFGVDGATDKSEKILGECSNDNIRVVSFKERRGKAAVLNDLLDLAGSEIIVFTDSNTIFEPQTIKELIKHFKDPTIGAVSGYLKLVQSTEQSVKTGEHTYWEYENIIKSWESRTFSMLGATGGVYAIRKKLFVLLPVDLSIADDFIIPMEIVKKGYRCVYEPKALAYEALGKNVSDEFRRKVRIGAQNINALPFIASLLHPRYGFIAFALLSHKIIRWFIPFFLILSFILGLLLYHNALVYRLMIVAWGLLLCTGSIGWLTEKTSMPIGFFIYPYYFLAMNYALFVGFFKAVFHTQKTTWNVYR